MKAQDLARKGFADTLPPLPPKVKPAKTRENHA
jgi:hypothetical protein